HQRPAFHRRHPPHGPPPTGPRLVPRPWRRLRRTVLTSRAGRTHRPNRVDHQPPANPPRQPHPHLERNYPVSGDTIITVVGNLIADPELRFTPNGAAVAGFTVASTPRKYNAATQQWEDGEALFLRCQVWRQAGENVAESLTK